MNLVLDTLQSRRSARWTGHLLGSLATLGLLGLSGLDRPETLRAAFTLLSAITLFELSATLFDARARRLKQMAPAVFPLKKLDDAERDFVQDSLLDLSPASVVRAQLAWVAGALALALFDAPLLASLAAAGLGLPVSAWTQYLINTSMVQRVLPFFYFKDEYADGFGRRLPSLERRYQQLALVTLSVGLTYPVLTSLWATPLSLSVSLWLLTWAVAAALGGVSTLRAIAIEPLVDLRLALGRFKDGDFSSILDVTSGDEVGQVTERYNKTVRAIDRRIFVLENFGPQVLPGKSEALFTDLRLDGEDRDVSILVCRWHEAAEALEGLAPPARLAALTRFVDLVYDAVNAQGGCVEGVEDGRVVAWFNAPLPHATPKLAAVDTAWAISLGLNVFCNQRRMRGEPAPTWGVAVASGSATCGLMGPPGRRRYACVGTPASLARDLVQAAQSQVLLCSDTASSLSGERKAEQGPDAFILTQALEPLPPDRNTLNALGFSPGERL